MSATMTSMIAAAPAMTSMYAQAPATYAQAPTMTSMYATPGASMYMPAAAATTYAAPVAYAAPTTQMVTTQAPSYVAAPQSFVAAPQTMQVMAAPQQQVVYETVQPQMVAAAGFGVPQPVLLTQGMVEPSKLEAEKVAYGKALELQLKKQCDACLQEATIKKAMLEQQYKTQVAQYNLQIEEGLKMDCLRVDQEAQTTCNGLREAAITQQTATDERCAIGVADFNKKKALEEYSFKSYEVQKVWFEKETQMTQQYQQVMRAGSKAVVTPNMPTIQGGGMVMETFAQQPVSYAAPQVTYAQPASYAAPAYAAPASYAAPVTMAAAPISYAQPASYAAPVTMAAAPVSYAPQMATSYAAPTTYAGGFTGTTTMMAAPTTVI